MAVNPNRQKLVHLNSATVKAPEGVLNKGEIAVQYASEDPALYIEKADGSLAKFISSAAVQTLIDESISAATEDFLALKADVTEAVGDIEAEVAGLSGAVITNESAIAEISGNSHSHDNKAVLDDITSEKVASWDEAAASAHTHANQAELDLIQSGDVDKWNALSGAAQVVVSARTAGLGEGVLKSYDVYQGGAVVGSIDIPKDLVVTSGGIVTVEEVKYLRLYIANQSEPVDVAVTDLVDAYTEGDGIEISTGNVISAKVVEANGLTVDANGIAIAAASAESAGTMSSADFVKLSGIESGANVNVIEGVQVNGANLTPDGSKKVNVTITSGATDGTIAVNGADVAVAGLGSAAFSAATDFDAAGAAEAASAAAITTVVGDMSGDTKTLGALQAAIAELPLGDENVIESVKVNGTALTPDGDKAVDITITGGSANGTIAVNGSDVDVTGLGSAAFEDASAFDEAGAAEAASAAAVTTVVGTAQDTSADTTVYGAKAYADELVAGVINAASGDTYISATADGQTIKVEATQSTKDSLALADSSLQGIKTGKESGAAVNANNELDFSAFGIDCGTY